MIQHHLVKETSQLKLTIYCFGPAILFRYMVINVKKLRRNNVEFSVSALDFGIPTHMLRDFFPCRRLLTFGGNRNISKQQRVMGTPFNHNLGLGHAGVI